MKILATSKLVDGNLVPSDDIQVALFDGGAFCGVHSADEPAPMMLPVSYEPGKSADDVASCFQHDAGLDFRDASAVKVGAVVAPE